MKPIENKNAMKRRSFTVILHREEDMYIAECPEVGTVDQGATIEQAISGLQEATRLYLEEFPLGNCGCSTLRTGFALQRRN